MKNFQSAHLRESPFACQWTASPSTYHSPLKFVPKASMCANNATGHAQIRTRQIVRYPLEVFECLPTAPLIHIHVSAFLQCHEGLRDQRANLIERHIGRDAGAPVSRCAPRHAYSFSILCSPISFICFANSFLFAI